MVGLRPEAGLGPPYKSPKSSPKVNRDAFAKVAPIYSVLLAIFVLLFGGAYAWLALQPTIDRPLVGFAAFGKASVFVAAVALWATGQGPGWFIPGATGDLIFAAIFGWWLRAGSLPR
jgi:hypothetical protein